MTYEEFKAIFLTKKNLGKKLRARVKEALNTLEEVRSLGETLPDDIRATAMKEIDDLDQRISDQLTKGMTKPGDAWVAMDALGKEVAQKKNEILGASKKADKADPTARFGRAMKPTLAAIAEARSGTRAISNQDEADKLTAAIEDLSKKTIKLIKDVGPTPAVPTAKHCEMLEEYRTTAGKLVREVREAQGLDPQPGTQRAISKAVVDGASGKIKAIGDRLNSPKKDSRGRTAKQDLQGRLEVFDQRFATDPDTSPEGAKRNNAMRMAAMASVTAERISDDINDPYLRPRIGKSLIGEYAPELKDTLAEGDDDEDDAKDAVLLAQALVMDDPITKLMGGKLDPSDAVQRIRDMAAVAGEPPSVMLKLLRQQFEMKIGSLTNTEVMAGKKEKDKKEDDSTQPFVLSDITGEIDPVLLGAMVEMTKTPIDQGATANAPDAPEWDGQGTGLAFKPTAKQVHKVAAKETFGTLAEKYLGKADDWKQLQGANKIVMNPATKKPEDLQKLGKDSPLPVGLLLSVPGNMSLLDQLAPYVEAWDEDEEEEEEEDVLGKTKPKKPKGEKKKKKYERVEITPEALKAGFANLRSPKEKDVEYTQAPSLGQKHAPREALGEKDSDMHGQLNPRQYAHLRMLARSDEEDREAILAKEGKPVEDVVAQRISLRYGKDRVDDTLARKIAKAAQAWIAKVPLTITFTADRLFSDPNKEGPTHGTKYKSEVEFSRGQKDVKDLIGRDKNVKGKVGTQGGVDTGWKEDRGENYMRWRRDKDNKEARQDELAYEDQQIFGAANPSFAAAKGSEQGGQAGGFGKNYYGNAHFLLNDSVRNRCAFIVRGASSVGDKVAVQRKNAEMLLYDMLSSSQDKEFLDAMLSMATGKGKVTVPGLKWEVHLYGGFDMTKDAKEVYLPDDLDPDLFKRIEKFATSKGVACKKIGAKPGDGIEIVEKQEPKQLVLPPL